MTEDKKPADLRDLDARLQQARQAAHKEADKGSPGSNSRSGLGFAMRLGVEMVSALVIGVAIGYFLDLWLGTKPWLMLLFFFLGSAAGFMGVYRAAAGLGQTVGYRQDKRKTQSDDKDSTGSDPSP
ncbi:MAG: AtpZ/AtpI family protein [Rhodospirillaceae bacterium]|jgi:ATP synthase protein I|nr:AtpZ/AtpI family protein [Rhodospirillaceae bacterium]MBT5457150.1 AtpZ/AtpI family protein [Rhodospirillaceae bacterium]